MTTFMKDKDFNVEFFATLPWTLPDIAIITF